MGNSLSYASSTSAVVEPWPLFLCQIVESPYRGMGYNWPEKFIRIKPSGNTKRPAEARLLPTSFLTAQLLALDVTDDDALVAFCDTYGPLVTPYAGAYDRMIRRLGDREFDIDAYSRLVKSQRPKGGLLGGLIGQDINPISLGMDLWYDGLHSSSENTFLYETDLSPLRAFGHQENSMANDVVAMVRAEEGVAPGDALVSIEDARWTAAMLQMGCALVVALDRFGDDYAAAYRSAIELDPCVRKSYRLLSGPGVPTDKDDDKVWSLHRDYKAKAEFDRLLDWLYPFMDMCLTRNGANRSMILTPELRKGRFSRPQNPVGSLAQAIVAQLIEYLEDGNPWKECAVCGRPFKYEQRSVGVLCSEKAAVEEATKAHRTTKAGFCCKKHEMQQSRAESARIRERSAPKKH